MKSTISLISLMIFTIISTANASTKTSIIQKKAEKAFKKLKIEKTEVNKMNSLVKSMRTQGTFENSVVVDVLNSCKIDTYNCEQNMNEALLSLYNMNGFTFLNPSVQSCASVGEDNYHAVIYGRNKDCGVTNIGPGLKFNGISLYGMICTHSSKGINVGPFAEINAAFGGGAGVTIGKSGLCAVLNFNIGFGAFAGLTFINTYKMH